MRPVRGAARASWCCAVPPSIHLALLAAAGVSADEGRRCDARFLVFTDTSVGAQTCAQAAAGRGVCAHMHPPTECTFVSVARL
jgi:hypothetical protein